MARADGTDPLELTFSGRARHPAWSPDSRNIAFELLSDARVSTPPSHLAIYIMDANGSNSHALSTDSYEQFGPVWSPDGSQIAFNSNDGIEIASVTGGVVRRIPTPIEFQSFISWSPDGSKFAFSCITQSTAGFRKTDICSINSDGTELRRLSDFDDARDPSWAPDGSQIVYTAKGHIFVMHADGTGIRQISQGDGRNRYAPRWSGDGTQIIYGNWSSVPPFPPGLYTIRMDGTGDLPFGIQDSYSGTADWSHIVNQH